MWHEVTIKKSNGGFGEYEAQPINGDGWADRFDLFDEMQANVDEELVDVDSVRAQELGIHSPTIRNEPDYVFAAFDGDAKVVRYYVGMSVVFS